MKADAFFKQAAIVVGERGDDYGPASVLFERIADGQTGTVATSDAQFARAAIGLLSDRDGFERMSAACRAARSGRTWQIAAAEFEDLAR